jgi:BON domain-containing protein
MQIKNIALAAALGLAVATTGLTGCANRQGRTTGQYWDDHRTAAHVKGALNKAPVYKFEGVNVTSYDRVIQLSGFVQTDDQRQKAGQIASGVQGVREVVNNILVKPEGTMSPTGPTNAPVRMGQPAAPSSSTTTTTTQTNAPAQPEQKTPTEPEQNK